MHVGDHDVDIVQRFADSFSAFLDTAQATALGRVRTEKRHAQFGFPGGNHHSNLYWVFEAGDDVEMLLGFNSNFSDNDLFVRVITAGEEIAKGSGATVQFNADRNLHRAQAAVALGHHLHVNPYGTGRMSRMDLLQGMADLAPGAYALVHSWLAGDAKSVALGSTADPAGLLDRVFTYAYAVEQVKRNARGKELVAEYPWEGGNGDEGNADVGEDDEDEFDPAQLTDTRDTVLGATHPRAGQREFRTALLKAYGGKCAISGSSVGVVLEAAHIAPYRGSGHDRVGNGLLLRADLHLLFDAGKLGVDPDTLIVTVHPSITSPYYQRFSGKPLRLPPDTAEHPSRKALRYRATLLPLGTRDP